MRRPPIAAVIAAALAVTTMAPPVSASNVSGSVLGARFAAQFRRSQRPVLGNGKIQHVIVVVQENRTVDNLFQGFPGADTVPSGLSQGQQKTLIPLPLQYNLDPDHSHQGFVTDYDGGAMDGFDHEYVNRACYQQTPQCTAYAYVQHSDSAIYFQLAQQYALADHVMQMNEGPSFTSHINLVAAQGGYPIAVAGNETPGANGPGCMSPDTSTVLGIDMRASFPNGLLQLALLHADADPVAEYFADTVDPTDLRASALQERSFERGHHGNAYPRRHS